MHALTYPPSQESSSSQGQHICWTQFFVCSVGCTHLASSSCVLCIYSHLFCSAVSSHQLLSNSQRRESQTHKGKRYQLLQTCRMISGMAWSATSPYFKSYWLWSSSIRASWKRRAPLNMNHATFRLDLNIKFQCIFCLFGDEVIPHEKLIPIPLV